MQTSTERQDIDIGKQEKKYDYRLFYSFCELHHKLFKLLKLSDNTRKKLCCVVLAQ